MKIDYAKLNGILEAKAGRAIDRLDGLKCYSPEFQETLDAILFMLDASKELDTYDTECQDCKQRKEVEERKSVYQPSAREIAGFDSAMNKEYKSIDDVDRNPNRIVLFYSEGCEPCRFLKPLIEKISVEENIELELVSVDTPLGTQHARDYGVRGWPTVLIVKNNQIADIGAGYDLNASEEFNTERYRQHIKEFF